jgi:hypothetical protein
MFASITPHGTNLWHYISWRIQDSGNNQSWLKNPVSASEYEICNGFTRPGLNSCSCTWDRTRCHREHHHRSDTLKAYAQVPLLRPLGHSCSGATSRQRSSPRTSVLSEGSCEKSLGPIN